jgi:hypothetical protein
LRARIRKTVAFAESVQEAQYAGAVDRKVSLSFAPPGKSGSGRSQSSMGATDRPISGC